MCFFTGFDDLITKCNADENCNVVSLKVDSDSAIGKDLMRAKNIRAFPTFILIKNGKEVKRMTGACKPKLERLIGQNKVKVVPELPEMTTMLALNQALMDAGDKLVVVGVFADWCPASVCAEPSKSQKI